MINTKTQISNHDDCQFLIDKVNSQRVRLMFPSQLVHKNITTYCSWEYKSIMLSRIVTIIAKVT